MTQSLTGLLYPDALMQLSQRVVAAREFLPDRFAGSRVALVGQPSVDAVLARTCAS
jgi:hypothetical protein